VFGNASHHGFCLATFDLRLQPRSYTKLRLVPFLVGLVVSRLVYVK
jgi:hypothetical protein